MVLIGLIIIANVLTALLVPGAPGIQWKPPVPTAASRRAGPDSARIPGGDIMNTFTSRGADAAPGNIYGTACALDNEGPHAKAVELHGFILRSAGHRGVSGRSECAPAW